MQAVVAEAVPSTWHRGDRRGFGRISGYARDLEAAQEAIGGSGEPGFIARLECDQACARVVWVELAEGCEELVRDGLVVLEFGWKLHEQGAELVAEAADVLKELLQESATVGELCGVGDGLGNLHGEAEVRRRAGCPSLPCFLLVRAMEAGVHLDAVEAVRAAFEMGALGRKVMRVRARQGPTGGADADCVREFRYGWNLLPLCFDAS